MKAGALWLDLKVVLVTFVVDPGFLPPKLPISIETYSMKIYG